MSGAPTYKPDNFVDDPERLLRQARKDKQKASVESPPAPPPPNYRWRPESSVPGSPAATDRYLYASSSVQETNTTSGSKIPFSPPIISPTASEGTVINLHFKKLLGDPNIGKTPHPPGFLSVDSPLTADASSVLLTPTLTSVPANTMANKQETIESLCQQLESMRIQNEELAQARQETLTLQKLVRDLLADKAKNTGNSGGRQDSGALGSGDGSNTFEKYLNAPPLTPTPLPPGPSARFEEPDDGQRLPMQSTPADLPNPTAGSHDTGRPEVTLQPEPTRPFSPRSAPSPHYQPMSQLPQQFNSITGVPYLQQGDQGFPVSSALMSTTADRVKLSGLPKFTGKFGKPADLFHWRSLIEETFEVKNVTDDREKLNLLGSLLNDEEMVSWYQSNKEELRRRSWSEAMEMIAIGTLPHSWLSDTEAAFRKLEMKAGESFNAYVSRGQAIHRLIKRQGQVTDRHLAQYITWGAPQLFQDMVDRENHLKKEPFSFAVFKDAADGIWRFLINSKLLPDPALKSKPPQSGFSGPVSTARSAPPQPRTRTEEDRADNAWRYHEYLRQSGICATCKEKCNNPACTKKNTRFLSAPSTFNPGPRPSKASIGPRPAAPGTPTQKPAGRPPVTPAVSRVAAIDTFPDVLTEDIAAYEEADRLRVDLVEGTTDERDQPSIGEYGE